MSSCKHRNHSPSARNIISYNEKNSKLSTTSIAFLCINNNKSQDEKIGLPLNWTLVTAFLCTNLMMFPSLRVSLTTWNNAITLEYQLVSYYNFFSRRTYTLTEIHLLVVLPSQRPRLIASGLLLPNYFKVFVLKSTYKSLILISNFRSKRLKQENVLVSSIYVYIHGVAPQLSGNPEGSKGP